MQSMHCFYKFFFFFAYNPLFIRIVYIGFGFGESGWKYNGQEMFFLEAYVGKDDLLYVNCQYLEK